MGMSVSANAGHGLANLLRQARPAKTSDEAAVSSDAGTTAVSLRPVGRSGIDSTGSGTAQMSAALTVYLSKLGGTDLPGSAAEPALAAVARTSQPNRSSAADLMRVLDTYRSDAQRLRA